MFKSQLRYIVVLVCALILFMVRYPSAEVIKNPKVTHIEEKYSDLILVDEIKEDFDEKNFMALPNALTVDDCGNIYIFDGKLKKIFKFDQQKRFCWSFGGVGVGPGDFHTMTNGRDILNYIDDGNIYALDAYNRKIIVVNKNGGMVKEIRLPWAGPPYNFFPVIDEKGNHYFYSLNRYHKSRESFSTQRKKKSSLLTFTADVIVKAALLIEVSKDGGILDVYDKEMNFLCSLLDINDLERFLIHRPNLNHLKLYPCEKKQYPRASNVFFDSLSGNKIVVYNVYSSTAYIIDNRRLIRSFDIWPKQLGQEQLDYVKKFLARGKYNERFHTPLMSGLIVDKDEPTFFYLLINGYNKLYKFCEDGKLSAVVRIKSYCDIKAKRNGLFFGIRIEEETRKIQIFKKMEKNQ